MAAPPQWSGGATTLLPMEQLVYVLGTYLLIICYCSELSTQLSSMDLVADEMCSVGRPRLPVYSQEKMDQDEVVASC